MKVKEIKKCAKKKAKKISKAVNIAATAVVVAFTVYSLIPRYEKVKGVGDAGFIK